MKTQRYHIFTALLILGLFVGCDHETDEFDGPDLIDRYGPFEVVEHLAASASAADFEAGEAIQFTAAFNKNVDWELCITGAESGSLKIINGFSRNLDETNAIWRGSTSQPPLFKAESCTVILTVPEEPEYADTIFVEVLSPKVYEGILVTDFEVVPAGSIEYGNYEFELTQQSGRVNDTIAGQGDWFYRLEGKDAEGGGSTDNYFVGLANIFPSVTGETYFNLPTTVPDNLYLNFFIFHDRSPYTRVVIQLAFDSNDNGVYNDGTDTTFELPTLDPDWNGWRLHSIRVADGGIGQAELEKLIAVRVLLISMNNLQPTPRLQVGFGIDYITFTAGGPLAL